MTACRRCTDLLIAVLCCACMAVLEGEGLRGSVGVQVCNVETDKLDDLKQHLRGKQHMRRLHNQKHRGE